MARTFLAAATVVWLLAGLAGLALGLLGAETLQRLLPPLAIDLPALGGAVVAVSAAIVVVAALHAAVVAGLRSRRRLAWVAGVLLAATLGALLAVLATAAATGAVTVPDRAPVLLAAALAAAAGAAGYGVVTALLVREIRSGPAI